MIDSRDATCGTSKKVEWTKKKPTKTGWYWMREENEVGQWCGVVFVFKNPITGLDCVQFPGTNDDEELGYLDAEWHGPIVPPE